MDKELKLLDGIEKHIEESIRKFEAERETRVIPTDPNSALLWLPAIERIGLPTPKTEIVEFEYFKGDLLEVFDGIESHSFETLVNNVHEACEKIGYPVFIRSDLTSAKHSGTSCYRADSYDDLHRVLYATLEDNEIKGCVPKAILVREWLNLKSEFVAFGGHAISHEFRFFSDGENVMCFHPYWTEESIRDARTADGIAIDNWRDLLLKFHVTPSNIEELKDLAIQAAKAYGVTSSVDLAEDETGKWWLTDMATARDSYHFPNCPDNV